MVSHDEPPADIGAEKQVLGAILLLPSVLDDVSGVVRSDDFYRPAHELIYSVALQLADQSEPIDAKLIGERLRIGGTLNQVGGLPYLHTLVEGCLTPANATHYAEIVARCAVQRRIIAAGYRIIQIASAPDVGDVNDLRHAALSEADAATADRTAPSIPWVSEDIDDVLASLEDPPAAKPSPWRDLDEYVGGFAPGRLYVVGSRPNVGKTVMAVQVGTHHAERYDVPVMMVSLEMSRREIELRLLSMIGKIPYEHLEQHTLTESDWDAIARVRGTLGSLRLSIFDRPGMRLTDIRREARTMLRDHNLGMVIVDYLQLISAGPGDQRKRWEVVSEYSRGLKLLSRELEVPVVAVSQLNRASADRRDKRPGLTDLRESGAVEQDADAVLLLHRDLDDPAEIHRLHCSVAKNRQGPTGSCELHFEGRYQRIGQRAWTPHDVLGN